MTYYNSKNFSQVGTYAAWKAGAAVLGVAAVIGVGVGYAAWKNVTDENARLRAVATSLITEGLCKNPNVPAITFNIERGFVSRLLGGGRFAVMQAEKKGDQFITIIAGYNSDPEMSIRSKDWLEFDRQRALCVRTDLVTGQSMYPLKPVGDQIQVLILQGQAPQRSAGPAAIVQQSERLQK